MIISRTPLRLSLCGGGTDYPQWYNEHGGAILGTSINHYVYVCLHNGQISHFFDLPNKSGLASSSAYTVGLLRVCSDFDKITISRLATTWEQDKTNGQVGSQDQYLCAIGGFHLLRFSEQGIRDTTINVEVVKPLEQYLMLFDTHQYRRNGDIIPQQMREMERHIEIYKRMTEMPEEGVTLIKTGDWLGFGKLLDQSWQMKKQLSLYISTPEIDTIYESAIKAGAVGGKLLGGGGGGFIVFFVEPDKQESVKSALSDLAYTPFKFEYEGTKVMYADSKPQS